MLARTASVVFARRTGRPWKVIRARMPAFYSSGVGDTEGNWYEFERRITAFGECIVICDEVDKVFGGVAGRDGDSGVSKSLFGLFLAWLGDPERRGGAYPILAMNDPSGIPPEALRAGRLDAGFYFGPPDAATRTEIARIHFRKRLARLGLGLDALGWTDSQWTLLGEQTEGYLPAEIETLVESARRAAFMADRSAMPDYNRTCRLVDDRRREVKADNDAAKVEAARKKMIDDLRAKCRAMGARPVHETPTPAEVPTPATPQRGRRTGPYARDENPN